MKKNRQPLKTQFATTKFTKNTKKPQIFAKRISCLSWFIEFANIIKLNFLRGCHNEPFDVTLSEAKGLSRGGFFARAQNDRRASFVMGLLLAIIFIFAAPQAVHAALNVQGGHGTVTSGSTGYASISVTNSSFLGALDVTIFEGIAHGIAVTPEEGMFRLDPGETRAVTMRIDATGVASDFRGTHNIRINFSSVFVQVGEEAPVFPQAQHAYVSVDLVPAPTPTPRPSPTPTPDLRANMVLLPQRNYITLMPGESRNVTITFRNDSERNIASNFTVQADMMVNWRNNIDRNRAQTVRPGESVSFQVLVNPLPGAAPGAHQIPISYFFFDQQNNRHTGTATVTVQVQETPEHTPQLIIDLFHTDMAEIRPGDSFTLFANVANIGSASAMGVEVTVSGFDPRGISLSGADTAVLQEIRRNDWDTAGFSLIASEDIAPGTYPVHFSVRYTGAGGQSRTFESSYFVTVTGEQGVARGRVISYGLSATTEAVDVGRDAVIHYTIRNTGGGYVHNVRVSLTLPTGIVPTNPNIQILEELPPYGVYEFIFTVSPSEEARTQTYLVGITTAYETGRTDADGTRATESFTQYASVNVRRAEAPAAEDERRAWLTAEATNPEERFDVGESGTISLRIRNAGNRTARNIIITAQPPSGIEPVTADIQTISSLAAGESRTLNFDFAPTAEAVTRVYSVRFTVEYESGQVRPDGSRVTGSFTQIGQIASSAGLRDYQARLVGEIASPEGRFNVNESGTFSLTLTNEGDRAATNIRIEAQPPAVTPSVIVPSSAHVQTIASLAVGESRMLEFDFMPTAEAVTRTYSVGFRIEFENGQTRADGTRITDSFMQYGSINSAVVPIPTPGADRSVPRIILSEYRITSPNEANPSIVLAGREFDMYMRVQNTHPTRTVTNIIVSLTMPEPPGTTAGTAGAVGNVFSPVDGSNSFFIPYIEPGGEVSLEIRMHCLHNAPGRNYVMRIVFEYEDAEGNPFTGAQEVGITVRQPDMFEVVGEINLPTQMSVGQTWDINFFFRNTGFVLLRNLLLVAEGDGFDVSGGIWNVGDFRPGNSDFYEGWVTALEPGEHELMIVVTYDLETGEHIRMEFPQTVTVTEGFEWDEMDFGGGMGGMGMGGMGGGMGGVVRAVPGGGMVIMEGGRGGMGGMGGFDPGMGFGFEEPAPEGFLATLAHWGQSAVNYMNNNIWVYFIIGAAVIAVAALLIVRGVKRRREYSLES